MVPPGARKKLKHTYNHLIFIAIALGIVFPTEGALRPWLSFSLGTMLFLNFSQLQLSGLRPRWSLVWKTLLAWLVILPLLAWALGYVVPSEFAVGLLLVAITPSAMATPILTRLMGGHFEFAVLCSVGSSLIAPFSYSLVASLVGSEASPRSLFFSVLCNVLKLVLIPFGLSLAIRLWRPLRAEVLKRAFFSKYILLFVVFSAVSLSSQSFREYNSSTLTLLALVTTVLVLGAFGLGYMLDKNKAERIAASVSVGQKNTGLCLWVVLNFFGKPAALVVVLYIVAQHLVSGSMIMLFSKHSKV
jgi:BASS family bile acid:Na+ symporter